MPFVIKRSFSPNYKSLLSRPRISHKVSEYVFGFVNDHLLKPAKLLQGEKLIYEFTFSFSFGIPKRTFPYTSPFATGKRLFFSQRGFEPADKMRKCATMQVVADDIDQNIAPFEYATVVCQMLADFFLGNYKKFDKAAFDRLLPEMDRSIIESFGFPAPFDEQRYDLDDVAYPLAPLEYGFDWVSIDKWITVDPRAAYLKHYPF